MVNPPEPRLMFTATTLCWLRITVNTCSSAASSSLPDATTHGAGDGEQVPAFVSRWKIWIDAMSAIGATPFGNEPLARPAAIPATWVPCAQLTPVAVVHGTPEPGPVSDHTFPGQSPGSQGQIDLRAKHASATTRPLSIECVPSTPVSMTATVWPVPRKPNCCTSFASTCGTLVVRSGCRTSSSTTLATTSDEPSASTAAGETASARYGMVSYL